MDVVNTNVAIRVRAVPPLPVSVVGLVFALRTIARYVPSFSADILAL